MAARHFHIGIPGSAIYKRKKNEKWKISNGENILVVVLDPVSSIIKRYYWEKKINFNLILWNLLFFIQKLFNPNDWIFIYCYLKYTH